MSNPPDHPEDSRCLLLVEGSDDKAVAIHLRNVVDSLPSFLADDRGSVEQVLDAIGLEVRAPGRKAVGVVVDANNSIEDRWRAIVGRLAKIGIEAPQQPETNGTIVDEQGYYCRVGVWLMPDNSSPGELEDFLLSMVPVGDPVWPRSQAYVEGIPEEDRRFSERKISRATLYAWLATREQPRQTGLAITAGDLEVEGTVAARFVDWLRRLFGDME